MSVHLPLFAGPFCFLFDYNLSRFSFSFVMFPCRASVSLRLSYYATFGVEAYAETILEYGS